MHRLKIIVTALCILLLTASVAIASGGEDHPIPWKNFALRVINLIAVLGIIYHFFGKKIAGFFKGRSQGIATEISSLEERKFEAQNQLKDVKSALPTLIGNARPSWRNTSPRARP